MLTDRLAVHIGNYNGFSHSLLGKGRIVWTIESLFGFYLEFDKLEVTIVDNQSNDGSQDFIRDLDFANKISRERITTQPNWLATTLNNMRNLGETIMATDKPYLWNIENCSYFYGSGLENIFAAIEVLDENSDISVVHLRRWTPMDAKDRPGCGRNYCRVKSVRKTSSGFEFYELERRDSHLIWINVGNDLGQDFVPDEKSGFGLHPLSETEIGGVRFKQDGSIEMLVEEHWGTYTSHGWIGRSEDMKFIVKLYHPLSEREMSRCIRKHFRAARLHKDSFVDFGWKTRNRDFSDDDVIRTLKHVSENNYSSVRDYGTFV